VSVILNKSFKLKELIEAIEVKAVEQNLELGRDFYSVKAAEYIYSETVKYETFTLILFTCPKSNSTIAVKMRA